MFKSVEDFQKFSKDQLEAATQSATALGHGVQQLLTETTELSKKSIETGTDAFQSLMASRSMDRAIQVQMEFARTAYDSMMAGSHKFNGILSATAQEMFKPIEGAFHKIKDTTTGV